MLLKESSCSGISKNSGLIQEWSDTGNVSAEPCYWWRFSHFGLVYSGCASQAFLLNIGVCKMHPDSKSPLDRTVVLAAALSTRMHSFCMQKYSIVHDKSVLISPYLQEQR